MERNQRKDRHMRVAIIGAGIGGLTAAAALRAKDIDVVVYEKAHELREVGAGVVVAAKDRQRPEVPRA